MRRNEEEGRATGPSNDRMCKAIRVGNVNDNVVRWNLADCVAALFGLRIDPRDDVVVLVV